MVNIATILIIGAGTGGMAAARILRQNLNQRHKVIIVEQNSEVYYQPSLLWLMTGRRKERDIARKTELMHAAGVNLICGKAQIIDITKKTVKITNGRTYSFDQLILAPGAVASQPDTEELARAGYNLYTMDGALNIHAAIKNFRGGEIVIVVTSLPYKCLPAVFEIAFLLNEWFVKRKIRSNVNISIYTPEVSPFQQAGIKVGQALRNKLQKHGINLFTGRRYQNVDPVKQIINFDSGPVPFNLLLYIPRHRTPDVISDSGLADKTGWVPVDPFTLETRHNDIYAIGDVNRIPLPSGFDLPKAGAFAHFQARIVAHNIQSKLEHKPPAGFFGGKSACVIETGTTAFPLLGNLYKQKPSFLVLPENRIWLTGKWLPERVWLFEHS